MDKGTYQFLFHLYETLANILIVLVNRLKRIRILYFFNAFKTPYFSKVCRQEVKKLTE